MRFFNLYAWSEAMEQEYLVFRNVPEDMVTECGTKSPCDRIVEVDLNEPDNEVITPGKYTKGPYTACLEIVRREVIGFHITAQPHGSTLSLARCEDAWDEEKRVFSPGELEANARLFTVAPKLYDAAESLLLDIESEIEQRKRSGNDEDWSDLERKANTLRAILAEVRGEQP
jgi:hypothetical protein